MRLASRLVSGCILSLILPALVFAQACVLSGFAQIPPNSPFAVGPNVYAAAVAIPQVATAVLAARDAWDTTDAAHRIGDWSGVVTGSDCPWGQPSQIGGFNFTSTSCVTNQAYGFEGSTTILAYVDYFPSQCLGCGTKSITVNTYHVFSVGPGPPLTGQYDLQSVMTHEFGHVLGLAHMHAGSCGATSNPSCGASGSMEAMSPLFYNTGPSETCQRTPTASDVGSANGAY